MAPKRKAKVVKTTRKVVQESVEVTLVENDQRLAAEAENGDQVRQQESESEVVKTTVIVEGESAGGADGAAVEILIEEPTQKDTAAATEAPRTPRQPEAKGKTQDQKATQQAKEKDREEREEEDREEREEDDETQSPEETPRPEAGKETETVDGEREKAQETEKERRPEKTEGERTPEKSEKERAPEKGLEVKQDKPKRAREVGEKARGGRRRRRRRVGEGGGEEQYKRYVFRVLKQVHPGLGISSTAMEVLNGYMNDMFERLAGEAARLSTYAGIKTLSSRDVQGAVRLVLPGDLGRHAIAEGAKALTNYMEHDDGGGDGDAKSKS